MEITALMVKELREKTGAGILDCKKALTETNGEMEKAIDWLRERGIAKANKKSDRIAAEGLTSVYYEGNNAVIYELNSETDFVAKNKLFLELIDKFDKGLLNIDFKDESELLKQKIDGETIESILINATSVIGEKITLRRVTKVVKTDDETFASYKHQGGRISTLVVLNGSEEVGKNIAMHVAAINPQHLSEEDISEEQIAKERDILTKTSIKENEESPKPKPEAIVLKMVEGRLNKYLKEICLVHQSYVKEPNISVMQYLKQNNATVKSYIRLEVGEGIEKEESNFAEEVMSQIKK